MTIYQQMFDVDRINTRLPTQISRYIIHRTLWPTIHTPAHEDYLQLRWGPAWLNHSRQLSLNHELQPAYPQSTCVHLTYAGSSKEIEHHVNQSVFGVCVCISVPHRKREYNCECARPKILPQALMLGRHILHISASNMRRGLIRTYMQERLRRPRQSSHSWKRSELVCTRDTRSIISMHKQWRPLANVHLPS